MRARRPRVPWAPLAPRALPACATRKPPFNEPCDSPPVMCMHLACIILTSRRLLETARPEWLRKGAGHVAQFRRPALKTSDAPSGADEPASALRRWEAATTRSAVVLIGAWTESLSMVTQRVSCRQSGLAPEPAWLLPHHKARSSTGTSLHVCDTRKSRCWWRCDEFETTWLNELHPYGGTLRHAAGRRGAMAAEHAARTMPRG